MATMEIEKRTDSSIRMAFAPDLLNVSGDTEDTTSMHDLKHTTSHLIAWYRCHFQGCRVVQKTYVPTSNFLGRVSYKTTWWLQA